MGYPLLLSWISNRDAHWIVLTLGFCYLGLLNVQANPGATSLPLSDVNVVALTDVHSWVAGHNTELEPYLNADFGTVLSFYETLQRITSAEERDLIMVDNGDFFHGTGLSLQPDRLFSILERMPFSAMNMGNHELYNDQLLGLMKDKGFIDHWGGKYLTSNTVWTDTQLPIGHRFAYLNTQHGKPRRLLVFGFLYDFEGACASATVQKVEEVVQQQWFVDVLQVNRKRNKSTSSLSTGSSRYNSTSNSTSNLAKDFVDYQYYDGILVLAHMGYDHPLIRVIHSAIRTITGNQKIPIQFIAGDSHVRGFAILDSSSTVVQPGRFLDTVGFVSFPWRPASFGQPEKELVNEAFKTSGKDPLDFHHVFLDANKEVLRETLSGNKTGLETGRGRGLSHFIQGSRLSLGLTNRIGCSGGHYQLDLPIDNPRSLWGLYVKEVIPMALGFNHSRIFIQNTMALKYDMFVGPVEVDDCVAISPVPDRMVRVMAEIQRENLLLLFDRLNVHGVNSKHPNLPRYAISPWPGPSLHPKKDNYLHSMRSRHHQTYELYCMQRDWPDIARALKAIADDDTNDFSTWDYSETPGHFYGSDEHPVTSYGVWIDFIKDNWTCVAPTTQLMIVSGKDLMIWLVVLTALFGIVHYNSWINGSSTNFRSGPGSYMRFGGVTVPKLQPKPTKRRRQNDLFPTRRSSSRHSPLPSIETHMESPDPSHASGESTPLYQPYGYYYEATPE